MSPSITIRPARAEDAPALGRLATMLVALHHDFDPQRFMAPTPRTAEGYGGFLKSQVGREGTLVLVAEADGEPVGYSYSTIEGHDWMALRGPAAVLQDILVDPARRGGGIGRRLLEETLARLTELGAPQIVLHTAQRNAAAQRLFAAAGFRPTMLEMTRDRPVERP